MRGCECTFFDSSHSRWLSPMALVRIRVLLLMSIGVPLGVGYCVGYCFLLRISNINVH